MPTFSFYVDWNRDGDFGDANENITAYVINADWSLGFRTALQDTADEGRLSLTLQNSDRRFSPEYSSGPYYGNFLPGRAVRVVANHNSTDYVMWTGFLEYVAPTPGSNRDKTARLMAVGAKRYLQDAEVRLPLMTNVTADEVIKAALERTVIPPVAAVFWRLGLTGFSELGITTDLADLDTYAFDMQVGKETFSYVGDNWEDGVNAYRVIKDVTAGERGRFFFARDGKATFWNRSYLQDLTTSVATINGNTWTEIEYVYGENLSNAVVVEIEPRTVSPDIVTVWELEEPLTVEGGKERTVNARFSGDTEGDRVAAKDVQQPMWGDTFLHDGDRAGACYIKSFETTARSARITLFNETSSNITVSMLTIKGIKLTQLNRLFIEQIDQTALEANSGVRMEYRVDTGVLSDALFAEQVARYELTRRKTPRGVVHNVNLIGGTDARYDLSIPRTIGDCITISDTQTDHNAKYVIIGENHRFEAGNLLRTTWQVEPLEFNAFWQLGIRDNLGTETILGF